MVKKRNRLLGILLVLCMITGCGKADNTESALKPEENVVVSDEMFTERDCDPSYDETEAIKVELKGNSAAASDSSVEISGQTITLTKDATHIITGSLENGMLIVNAPDSAKMQLVFQDVTITNETSAALYVKEADKVFVTLEGENALENGGSFEAIDENNIDATVFSKQDLTFNGSGTLTVNSPSGHGIVTKDDLVITGGTYQVASSNHGLDANDSVRIKDAKVTIDAGKDGIHSENTEKEEKGFVYIESGTFSVESEGDGISAGSTMQVAGGTFDILAGGGYENGTKESSGGWGDFGGGFGDGPGGMPGGGGPGMRGGEKKERPGTESNSGASTTSLSENTSLDDSSSSMKGIKSGKDMVISGGTFTIDSADDALHSNTSMEVKGGSFEIASGDDALHAEEKLTVYDGKLNITTCYEGLEALHVAVSGGDIKLEASDDGLNAAGGVDDSGNGGRDNRFGGGPGGMSANSDGSIVISDGTLYIHSSGDGIDANGTLEICGGHTTIVGPTQGDTATLDFDVSAVITGGTFIGTGSSMMAQTFSSSEQGVVAVSVGSQSAGSEIVLKNAEGKELLNYSPQLDYQVVILSTPEMNSGEVYTIQIGEQSGEIEAQ